MTSLPKTRTLLAPAALALAAALSGCASQPNNRLMDSIHQPVVRHDDYSLDLVSTPGGLSAGEQARLKGWFEAMNLKYGDRISLDDPLKNPATITAVSGVAARFGLELGREVPVTEGAVGAGTVRITITRASATVPGCPDWSRNAEMDFRNATSSNFGCAINSNLAAMVANPDHLLAGATASGQTVVMTSNKAIDAYRTARPSGGGGGQVKQTSSQGN